MSTCPCTLIEPCKKHCACANPTRSGACYRCASYGSEEQKIATAKWIALRIELGHHLWRTGGNIPAGMWQELEATGKVFKSWID